MIGEIEHGLLIDREGAVADRWREIALHVDSLISSIVSIKVHKICPVLIVLDQLDR